MDRAEIISVLTSLLDERSEHLIEAQRLADRFPAEYRQVGLIHALAEPVGTVLSRQPEFADGLGYLVHAPAMASGLYAKDAARALVTKRLAGESAEAGVDWLERVLGTEEARGSLIMVLSGVTTKENLDLGHNIRLVPIENLPESSQRNTFLEPESLRGLHLSRFHLRQPPTVALTVEGFVRPFLTRSDAEHDKADPFKYHNLLGDARLALTCIGPSAPLQVGTWFQYEPAELGQASVYGGISSTVYELVPTPFAPEVTINESEGREVVSNFLALEGAVRKRVRVSLQRLNQAVLRREAGDIALELSIALEALLATGQGENTYKVGLRAALIGGGSLERRMENRAIVSAVYVLRSAIVHNGTTPRTVKVMHKGKVSPREVTEEGTRIVASVIRTIMARGKLPDWNSFELDG